MVTSLNRNLKCFFVFLSLLILLCIAETAAAKEPVRLLVPGTPSAIPLIIAAQNSGDMDVKIVQNRAQAHASFIRGDAELVLTGLSAGIKIFEQGVPVKMLASHVTSLSYLVVNRDLAGQVNTFKDLIGQTISFPFPGSPLEEVSHYFIEQEGLQPGRDFTISYNTLQLAVMLLKQGKLAAAPLPEPFATLAVNTSDKLVVTIDYGRHWHDYNGGDYPQVVLLVKAPWLHRHSEWLDRFKPLLQEAIEICESDPEKAVSMVRDSFTLSDEVLLSALKHSGFRLQTGEELQQSVFSYYKLIGKDLEEQEQFQYGRLF